MDSNKFESNAQERFYMTENNSETEHLIDNPNQLTGEHVGTVYGDNDWSIDSDSKKDQKISYSNLRVRQLNNLRSATAPRDRKLDKTLELPREARLGKALPPVKVEQRDGSTPRPWHRLWARVIDGFVLAFIGALPPFVTGFVFGVLGAREGAEIALLLSYLVALPMVLLYEPFCICLYGTTVGKSLFKIHIWDARTGSNLTFGKSVQRYLWMLWYSGNMLTVVPIVGLFSPFVGHIMQYKKLMRDKVTRYDERLYIKYTHG